MKMANAEYSTDNNQSGIATPANMQELAEVISINLGYAEGVIQVLSERMGGIDIATESTLEAVMLFIRKASDMATKIELGKVGEK
jgi:hypothetical protein